MLDATFPASHEQELLQPLKKKRWIERISSREPSISIG
jgi:hypothetical protein